MTYVMDVVEQSGPDVLRASFWDWAELSDLYAEFKVGA